MELVIAIVVLGTLIGSGILMLRSPTLRLLAYPLFAIAILLLANSLAIDHFFAIEVHDGGVGGFRFYGRLIDIFTYGAPVMLLALGMTLVIATGGVDLSVGAVMAISASIAAMMVTAAHPYNFALAAGLAILVSTLCGLWNGFLVGIVGIQPIVATLVWMVSGRGAAQIITDGNVVTFVNQSAPYTFLGSGFLFGLPFSIYIVAGMLLVTYLFSRQTALGLMIESVGDNAQASRRVGVPVVGVLLLVYAFAGLCAGVAGLVATATIQSSDPNTTGLYFELDAIFAVVVGGTALTGGRYYLLGSIIGALLLQSLRTSMLAYGVPVEVIPMPVAIAIVLVCLLQSPRFRRQLGVFIPKKPNAGRAEVAA